MGRFGYVSKEEVMSGFELSEQDARNRLNYLARQELIRPFPSLASPQYFYCLKMVAKILSASKSLLTNGLS